MKVPKRALWIGGGIVAAAAVVGVVAYASSKPTAAAAPVTPPPPPTGTVTLDVAAGTANAQIGTQQSLNLQLPTGAVFVGLVVDNASVSLTSGQNTSVVPAGLSIGAHSIQAYWTDSTGAAQTSQINLTVTQ